MPSIYIHWPFCISKCDYCDFHSRVREDIDYEEWLLKYKKAMIFFKDRGSKINSIYFGGGTPSLLPAWFIRDLIGFIRLNFEVSEEAEITLEANPGTIPENIAESGVNRISIGVQSIYDIGLQILGRRSHTAGEAIRCVHNMSEIFENVSIDVIYNRPGQSPEEWHSELLEVLELFSERIQHISCYELIVEENTPLGKDILAGKTPKPSETDEFFDITHDVLPKNGFEMYEVSNFSKPGFQSKHNLAYWRYEDYFGVGPGAHSRVTSKNGRKLAIEYTKDHKFIVEELSQKDILKEKVIMGLRAKCGVNLADFPISQEKISRLIKNCYVVFENGRIIMTYEGIKRLNMIVEYILDSCIV